MAALFPETSRGDHQHARHRRALQPEAQLRAAQLPAARPRHAARRERRRVPGPLLPRAPARSATRTRPSTSRQRLEYELEVIRKTGFSAYILLVWDFVAWAREQKIPCGPRGSAAGSIILYLLGIADVDPIEYGLTFERFLNPERVQMPDVDMDFADERRDEVIQYVHRAVRPRPRRPDRHVRAAAGAGRDPRRRPGAQLPAQRGRPRRQADPADPGRHDDRQVAGPGQGAEAALRGRPVRQAAARRGAGRRGRRPPRLAPTPPAS